MNRGAFSFAMSLKAKLEAVIYAAEEPVTLAQLAAIFAEELPQELQDEAAPEFEPLDSPEQIQLQGLASEGEARPEAESVAEPSCRSCGSIR